MALVVGIESDFMGPIFHADGYQVVICCLFNAFIETLLRVIISFYFKHCINRTSTKHNGTSGGTETIYRLG